MDDAQPKQNGHRKPQLHGLYTLKSAIRQLGGRVIDKRYRVGRALAEWKAEIVADLGGDRSLSASERTLVDLCVKNKLLLDSVDAWLLTQKSLVNARRRSLYPVVIQRQTLQDSLVRNLTTLGLKRVAREITMDQMIQHALKEQEQNGNNGTVNAENGNDEGSGGL